MRIGVLGAGSLGRTLAQWCAESGHQVVLGNASQLPSPGAGLGASDPASSAGRGAGAAALFAAGVPGAAALLSAYVPVFPEAVPVAAPAPAPGELIALSIEEAAAFADTVLVAGPWSQARDSIDRARQALNGKVVIDATDPNGDTGAGSGLGAMMASVPEAHWVKALNTLPPQVLERRRGHDPLLAEFVCTDLADAREAASQIIRDLGFAPIYAGGAKTAKLTESGGPLRMCEVDVADATAVLAQALSALD